MFLPHFGLFRILLLYRPTNRIEFIIYYFLCRLPTCDRNLEPIIYMLTRIKESHPCLWHLLFEFHTQFSYNTPKPHCLAANIHNQKCCDLPPPPSLLPPTPFQGIRCSNTKFSSWLLYSFIITLNTNFPRLNIKKPCVLFFSYSFLQGSSLTSTKHSISDSLPNLYQAESSCSTV